MKTILAVLADGFEETEAVAVLDVLRRLEFDVTTAGLKAREVMGSHWIPMVADTTLAECGDAKIIKKLAELLAEEPEEFSGYLRKYLKEGNSFPKARSLALADYAAAHEEYADTVGVLDQPNNALGVAYAVAIIKAGLDVELHTVKRLGSGHDALDIDAPYPSSGAVRAAFRRGEMSKIAKAVP